MDTYILSSFYEKIIGITYLIRRVSIQELRKLIQSMFTNTLQQIFHIDKRDFLVLQVQTFGTLLRARLYFLLYYVDTS